METTTQKTAGPPAADPELITVPPEVQSWLDSQHGKLKAKGPHLTLAELKVLVAQRQAWGEYWDVPEHVSGCPVCLALFESLLQGVTEPEAETLDAMFKLDKKSSHRWFRLVPALPKLARVAAVFAVLAAGSWYLVTCFSPPAVAMVSGALQLENGKEIVGGGTIPGGATLQVKQSATAQFADGSQVLIDRDSRFALATSRFHGENVQLAEGKVTCQVSKQKEGRTFKVMTPVGEVTVVGTQFTVASQKVTDTVAPAKSAAKATGKSGLHFLHPLLVGVRDEGLLSSAAKNNMVTVQVKEGVVLVRNRYGQQTRLAAGQTAVLRDNLRIIDVYGSNPAVL